MFTKIGTLSLSAGVDAMLNQRIQHAATVTNPRLRKLLAALPPPDDGSLLDKLTAKTVRELDRILSHAGKNSRLVKAQLDALTATAPPLQVRGGFLPLAGVTSVRQPIGSISDLLSGLYLPVDAPNAMVPLERRYNTPQTWTSSMNGGASANEKLGNLLSSQFVNLSAGKESSWAAFDIVFPTTVAKHGRLCRVTLDAELDWQARHLVDVNFVWNTRLDGTMFFRSNIWLDAWEMNPSAGGLARVAAPSSVKFEVLYGSWYINSGGMEARSGSLRNGAASFQFLATPPRTYVMRVLTESRSSHTIRNVDGGPIPPPKSGDFVAYNLTKASVAEMWVSYEVLTR
jgi:hypothetical protein